MERWGPYPEPKKLPLSQGGKTETSGETGERPQHQQYQRYVAGNPDHHRLQKQEHPIMCEAKLPDELDNFYSRFDLLNKESRKYE